MIIAGLTGGIASGKSTISSFFSEAGAHIIDADQIARQVVAVGSPAYKQILAYFGRSILLPNEEINRRRLGDVIFNDPNKKARLDAIVHPYVFAQSREFIATLADHEPNAVVILDVPLLLETHMHHNLNEVIVVYVPEIIQLKRLLQRDGLSEQAAMARIRSQMPIEEKRKHATVVIDNSGSRNASRKQTRAAYNQLKQKSKKPLDKSALARLFNSPCP